MKDNQQLGQVIFKMSEGKRKQLFSHLLNEFRNSKVNLDGSQNYASGNGGQSISNQGTLTGSNKQHKKKALSIDKKGYQQLQNPSDLVKKGYSTKEGTHKKSKSHIYQNIDEVMKENTNYYQKVNHSGHMHQVPPKYNDQTMTLEHSFVKNSMNKSYERIMADTIEAQNSSSGGYHHQQKSQYEKYHMAAQQHQHQPGYSTKHHPKPHSQNNMTLQFTSSQTKRGSASTNVSQTRVSYENQNRSNHTSHKSLSQSKYDQQSKKKSRRQDQLYLSSNNRAKCESNRTTSKKTSPINNTISASTTAKNTLNIREARTKPTSPDRSFMLVHGYKPTSTTHNSKKSMYSGVQMVNQREERQALNMINNIGKKGDMLISTAGGFTSMSQGGPPNKKQDFSSIQSNTNTQKRKNFKNMFYSPKGNREAYTEPHSKVVSQAQTKDNSPRDSQVIKVKTIQGHHPQIRGASNKPPSQLKSKAIYSTKDSYNNYQKILLADETNSFLEESYMRSNLPGRKEEISFESSQNQFSQTGTPITYQQKQGGTKVIIGAGHSKNLSNVGSMSNQDSYTHQYQQPPQIDTSKPKKFNYPHTTGIPSKVNSQVPSPKSSKPPQSNHHQPQQPKYRFQSEAPSPVNMKNKQQDQAIKKRGQSIDLDQSESSFAAQQQQKVVMTFKGKPLVVSGGSSQQQQASNPQQFLFNQYVKNKKQRYSSCYGSQDASLERQSENNMFEKAETKTQQSPRTKEVTLIKTLIKECFDKYGKPPKTQLELYKIGKMLGKGAFGKVNMGLHRLTRKLVAIKSINMEYMKDESSKKKMSNEMSILKMLRHPNVTKMLETFDIEKHNLIVMELCPGGDLLNYVRKRRKLNEKYAKFVFKQIMEGIAYLHHMGIVHRDIKLDNILLDGHGNIKIGDFGVSRKTVENEILFEQCGTPAYIAPEIVRELGYKGFPVDIWSAGVCLYAMLYGNVPFKANQMGDLNKMIMDSVIEYKDTVSAEARELMQFMMLKNPNKRLTAEQVLDHPWFDDVDEHIDIFDEQELDLIKKEFTYVSQKAKLKELKCRKAEDLNTEFTEHSIDNTNDDLLRNNSSRSVILCPFNTQSGNQQSIYEEVKDLMEDKDIMIRFNVRVRELDRQYEKFNNQDFDNGVYHKYAYNQGKKDGDKDDALKEENIDQDEVDHKSLVARKDRRKRENPDANYQNFYLKRDEQVISMVEEFGFPRDYIVKCLNENVNNHCTTSYYLLCMDQNY